MPDIDLKRVLALHRDWLDGKEEGERANLIGANLIGANLRGTLLSRANLIGANLRGANLIGANLIGADLRGARLRDARLRDANLHNADLSGANLRGARLRGAELPPGYIEGFTEYPWHLSHPPEGPTLQIGCESHTLDEWDARCGLIVAEHHADRGNRTEQIRALVAFCRTQPTPKEARDA